MIKATICELTGECKHPSSFVGIVEDPQTQKPKRRSFLIIPLLTRTKAIA